MLTVYHGYLLFQTFETILVSNGIEFSTAQPYDLWAMTQIKGVEHSKHSVVTYDSYDDEMMQNIENYQIPKICRVNAQIFVTDLSLWSNWWLEGDSHRNCRQWFYFS